MTLQQFKVIQGRQSWCQWKAHMWLPISHYVTLAVSDTVFEIFTLKARKLQNFPTPPFFDAPARGNPLEFRDETYPAKTRGMGLPYGENFIILTLTVFLWSTRLTDRRTDGRTGDSIYAL